MDGNFIGSRLEDEAGSRRLGLSALGRDLARKVIVAGAVNQGVRKPITGSVYRGRRQRILDEAVGQRQLGIGAKWNDFPIAIPAQPDLAAAMLEWLRENAELTPEQRAEISADTNLLESGIIDSVAFLELLIFVEASIGSPIDLAEIDPAALRSVDSLSHHAVSLLRGHHG